MFISEALEVLDKRAAEVAENSEQKGYHANTSQNAPALSAQQQQNARPVSPYRPPVIMPNVPRVGEPQIPCLKVAASRAFDTAYEEALRKAGIMQ